MARFSARGANRYKSAINLAHSTCDVITTSTEINFFDILNKDLYYRMPKEPSDGALSSVEEMDE